MFDGRYELWGNEHSFFTRKLQALLRYQGLDFDFRIKGQAEAKTIEARVGTHMIPALKTPADWFIHDTTPIGLMLDAKYPERAIVPRTPVQRTACLLLEDWLDEWLGLHVLHTRWCYPENMDALGAAFAANMLGQPGGAPLTEAQRENAGRMVLMLRDQFGLPACKRRGCGPERADFIRRDFDRLMGALQRHFARHPFLLGDRACLADFTLAGAFYAHFISDPEPRRWVDEQAPELIDAMERIWNARCGEAWWPRDDALPETLAPLVEQMTSGYHRCLTATHQALADGEKWCVPEVDGTPLKMRALKYWEVSRGHVKSEIERLSAAARKAVDEALGPTGALTVYVAPSLFGTDSAMEARP
mgnify:CR=1 FL=1